MRAFVAVVMLAALASSARAEDADAVRTDRERALHAAAIVAGGSLYLASELVWKDELVPDACRWCDPPSFDRAIRDALVWDDPKLAARFADGTGYVAAPVAAIGLLTAAGWNAGDWRRWFDDVSPVLESAIAVSLVNQATKMLVGRARPLAHFALPDREYDTDDDLSFFSGHTSLAFSLAVSAGVVARQRGYALEPVIWATGLSLAGATSYLRIAADKHYASDVAVGAVIGAAFGVLVPRVFHSDTLFRADTRVVVSPRGLALIGTF